LDRLAYFVKHRSWAEDLLIESRRKAFPQARPIDSNGARPAKGNTMIIDYADHVQQKVPGIRSGGCCQVRTAARTRIADAKSDARAGLGRLSDGGALYRAGIYVAGGLITGCAVVTANNAANNVGPGESL
jgi:hypothetical protein